MEQNATLNKWIVTLLRWSMSRLTLKVWSLVWMCSLRVPFSKTFDSTVLSDIVFNHHMCMTFFPRTLKKLNLKNLASVLVKNKMLQTTATVYIQTFTLIHLYWKYVLFWMHNNYQISRWPHQQQTNVKSFQKQDCLLLKYHRKCMNISIHF